MGTGKLVPSSVLENRDVEKSEVTSESSEYESSLLELRSVIGGQKCVLRNLYIYFFLISWCQEKGFGKPSFVSSSLKWAKQKILGHSFVLFLFLALFEYVVVAIHREEQSPPLLLQEGSWWNSIHRETILTPMYIGNGPENNAQLLKSTATL